MTKIVVNLQVSWTWAGDEDKLKFFKLAVTENTGDPDVEAIATAECRGDAPYTFTFKNLLLEKDTTYKVHIKTIFQAGESAWTSLQFTPSNISDDNIIEVKADLAEFKDLSKNAQQKINFQKGNFYHFFDDLKGADGSSPAIATEITIYENEGPNGNAVGITTSAGNLVNNPANPATQYININGGTQYTVSGYGKDGNINVNAILGEAKRVSNNKNVGEAFTVSTGSQTSVTFTNTYNDPVVFAQVKSNNNVEPSTASVKNITSTGADIILNNPANEPLGELANNANGLLLSSGQFLSIFSGPGAGQTKKITKVISNQKVNVDSPWTTVPTIASTHGIANYIGPILAVGEGTAILDATASTIDDIFKNKTIKIRSGTGAGQNKVISYYDGDNKRIFINQPWTTMPDSTSIYDIVAKDGIGFDSGSGQIVKLDSLTAGSDDYTGYTLSIVSGTGSGQTRTIVRYDVNEKIAYLDTAWATDPDATSTFEVIMHSGRLVSATSSAIKIGPEAPTDPNQYINKILSFYDGENVGQLIKISNFDASEFLILFSEPFVSFPELNDTIQVIDNGGTATGGSGTMLNVTLVDSANLEDLYDSAIRFITGANAGEVRYIVEIPDSNTIEINSAFPNAISNGDKFEIWTSYGLMGSNSSNEALSETISVVVFEKGTYSLDNGLRIHVGSTTTDKINLSEPGFGVTWDTVTFPALPNFVNPIILTQVQTDNNGLDGLRTRVKSPTATSFQLTLELDSTRTTGLGSTETVGFAVIESHNNTLGAEAKLSTLSSSTNSFGYAASFATSYCVIAQMMSAASTDCAFIRITSTTPDNFAAKIQEDTFFDEETTHPSETIGYLAILEGSLSGRKYVRSTDFEHISFQHQIYNPILVFGPLTTHNGNTPVVLRTKNLNNSGFDFTIIGPNTWHLLEDFSYLVLTEGTHSSLLGSQTVYAKKINVPSSAAICSAEAGGSHNFVLNEYIDINSFNSPIAFSSLVTYNSPIDFLHAKTKLYASGEYFNLEYELESYGNTNGSTLSSSEEVHVIIVEENVGNPAEQPNIKKDLIAVSSAETEFSFGYTYAEPPVLLACSQNVADNDAYVLRNSTISTTTAGLKCLEDTTQDPETTHGSESVGYLVMPTDTVIKESLGVATTSLFLTKNNQPLTFYSNTNTIEVIPNSNVQKMQVENRGFATPFIEGTKASSYLHYDIDINSENWAFGFYAYALDSTRPGVFIQILNDLAKGFLILGSGTVVALYNYYSSGTVSSNMDLGTLEKRYYFYLLVKSQNKAYLYIDGDLKITLTLPEPDQSLTKLKFNSGTNNNILLSSPFYVDGATDLIDKAPMLAKHQGNIYNDILYYFKNSKLDLSGDFTGTVAGKTATDIAATIKDGGGINDGVDLGSAYRLDQFGRIIYKYTNKQMLAGPYIQGITVSSDGFTLINPETNFISGAKAGNFRFEQFEAASNFHSKTTSAQTLDELANDGVLFVDFLQQIPSSGYVYITPFDGTYTNNKVYRLQYGWISTPDLEIGISSPAIYMKTKPSDSWTLVTDLNVTIPAGSFVGFGSTDETVSPARILINKDHELIGFDNNGLIQSRFAPTGDTFSVIDRLIFKSNENLPILNIKNSTTLTSDTTTILTENAVKGYVDSTISAKKHSMCLSFIADGDMSEFTGNMYTKYPLKIPYVMPIPLNLSTASFSAGSLGNSPLISFNIKINGSVVDQFTVDTDKETHYIFTLSGITVDADSTIEITPTYRSGTIVDVLITLYFD